MFNRLPTVDFADVSEGKKTIEDALEATIDSLQTLRANGSRRHLGQ